MEKLSTETSGSSVEKAAEVLLAAKVVETSAKAILQNASTLDTSTIVSNVATAVSANVNKDYSAIAETVQEKTSATNKATVILKPVGNILVFQHWFLLSLTNKTT